MRSLDAGAYPLELTSIQLQDWIPPITESFQAHIQVQQQSLQISLPSELPPLVSDLPITSTQGWTRFMVEIPNLELSLQEVEHACDG